jgi:head-tail adaptor
VAIAAGKRDRRIRFEQLSVTRSKLGVEKEDFTDIGAAWAAVSFGSGSERREGAANIDAQAAIFRVRASTLTRDITRRDRIVFQNAAWGIMSISPVGAKGHEIEFGAVFVEGRSDV